MFFLKKIINFIIYLFIKLRILKLPKKSLRILMFHNITDYKKFVSQIRLLQKEWRIISYREFYKIIRKQKKIEERLLLLTFDDGFKSNYYVAEKYLKNMNLNAIFFVPLKFVTLKNRKEINHFIKNNLKIQFLKKNMINLNFKDLKKMIKLNNLIGAHTFSHLNLNFIKDKKKIYFEIVKSANLLQKKLNIKIRNFSFNFGRLEHISPISLNIAKKRFENIFTGIRGDNLHSQKIFFRDNIYPTDNIFDLYSYLGGYLDFLYYKERQIVLKASKSLNSKF